MNADTAVLIDKLFASDTDNVKVVQGIFDLVRREEAVDIGRRVRDLAAQKTREHRGQPDQKEFLELYWDIMLWLAPNDFDSFMLFLEKNRKPQDRFYQPRRKQLKPITEALQALADDELDYLFVSQPPRTGKTTIMSMFYVWIMGKWPEISNLYSSYSGYVVKTFYTGILEMLNDPDTYCYAEIFPKAKLVATDAQDLRIDIERKKKYPTLTCRSIDGALNGGADCQGVLCGDDLLEGIEEAMSPDRLAKKWSLVLNNLLTRQVGAKGKVILNGTRWSLYDVLGRMQELLETNPAYKNVRYRVINLPALDENDESNFDYDYGKGMTTEQYKQRRAAMEESGQLADWLAQYQGEPVERNGQLFAPDNMRFYNGVLPDRAPDRVFAFCDTAFGGGDYVSMPIAYQYDTDIYIHGVVYNNGDKSVTIPLVAKALMDHPVGSCAFEGTRTTADYKDDVNKILAANDCRINIMMKAPSTRMRKEERIFDKSPEIREFYFLDTAHRTPEYAAFMRCVHAFTISGKNKFDDAPDSLAGLADMVRRPVKTAVVFARPF